MRNVVEIREKSILEEEAATWLIKLDRDRELSTAEHAELRLWLDSSPAHRRRLSQLANRWDQQNILTELAVPLGKTGSIRRRSNGGWGQFRYATAAVALIVAITVSSFIWFDTESPTESNGVFATVVGQQETAVLSDGSIIMLNTNTQIKVEFNESYRDIFLLQGEAHFTVAKNDNIPFRVFAGIGRIDAVGTAFSVYLNGKDVDVTVTEGRVALTAVASPKFSGPTAGGDQLAIEIEQEPESSLGELHAGQVATISRQVDGQPNRLKLLNNLRDIDSTNISKRLSWTKGMLVFTGDPLEDVVEEISRYTTVSIEFSDPSVGTIPIGGRFPVGETDTMFRLLESNFGLNITRLDQNHVLVSKTKVQ